MKVVLLKDVKDTGRAGSIITVSDGHGLHFLIPRGLAALATPTALKIAESRQHLVVAKRELDSKLVSDRLAALAEEKIVIVKKANDKGHLYDAVDAKDIADAAKLPAETIKLEKSIKEIGIYDVPVAFGENFGSISVSVEAE